MILRDLGSLQMQIRDYDGIVKTREVVLKQRPQVTMHWVQLAVAAHVAGDQALAEKTLDSAVERMRKDRDAFMEANRSAAHEKKRAAVQALQRDWLQARHELGELLLYRAQMYAEDGQFAAGVAFLDANAADVADKLGLREARAALLLRAGRHTEAAAAYETLLRINPDNADYHRGYLSARLGGADAAAPEQYGAVQAHCAALQKAYPGSRLVQVFCLSLLRGADYAALFERVLVAGLRRGVPSMYQVLKPVLDTEERRAAVRALLERILKSLEEHGTFDGRPVGAEGGEREAPSCTLWATLFAAQFYARDTEEGGLARAQALVGAAERHTPTAVEVYMVKAKVLARAGDACGAAEAFEHARKLDLADRYLNNKATKYLLRANRPRAATATIALFLKGEEHGTPDQLLAGAQCRWFEWELARCHERRGAPARALKRYAAVCDHYAAHVQEAFDYNYYAFRKNTLRAYEQLLRFTETLPEHAPYQRAALRAVEIYLAEAARRAADPHAVQQATEQREAFERADAERERERRRRAASQTSAAAKREAEQAPEPDADPDGARLLCVADPLAVAQRLLDTMLANARNPRVALRVPAAVPCAAARVALARGRPVAEAVALVRRAAETDAADPAVLRAALLVLRAAPAECPGIDWVRAHVLAGVAADADAGRALDALLGAAHTLPACVELLRAAEEIVPVEERGARRAAFAQRLEGSVEKAALGELVDAALFVQHSPLFDDEARAHFLAHCKSRFPSGTIFDLVAHPLQEEEEEEKEKEKEETSEASQKP